MAPAQGEQRQLLLSPPARDPRPSRGRRLAAAFAVAAAVCLALLVLVPAAAPIAPPDEKRLKSTAGPDAVESEVAAVAADDARCSRVGAAALREGGHAVDAAVAAALCLGVVHPVSSGIGGGAFIVVRSAAGGGVADAFDARETAPGKASENMYIDNPSAQSRGVLAMGIPGELAGLHAIWAQYGRLPWKHLFEPAIDLARNGFTIVPYVAYALEAVESYILADPGLRAVFAPNGHILRVNDTCYNPVLANTLETISKQGPGVFYNGSVGEKFIEDIRARGGIVTIEDLRGYKVEVSKPLVAHVMGYTVLGMPPPSSGTVGMSMVLNILSGYPSLGYLKSYLGLHRLVESLKHMMAIRMNLGDPDFINDSKYVADMLSPAFADKIRSKILDNTTFSPSYYMSRWSQLRDHGTSHLCVVDSDRNAVSMTTTVNGYFGAKVLSPSTGIILNNEMDDFSVVSNPLLDQLPPAPANFIKPHKRPLSSMTPVIILKDNQLAGVIGASGGTNIIATVIQVFLKHFIIGMKPLAAVQHPRIYHTLIPNKVSYENYSAIDGEPMVYDAAAIDFLKQRGHQVASLSMMSSVSQFIAQDLKLPVMPQQGRTDDGDGVFRGLLTAVSDPRKDGSPAGL